MTIKAKRWLITLGGLLLVVGLLGGIKVGQIVTMVRANEAFTPPPETVAAAKVQEESWEESQSAIGTLVAFRAVTVSAELPGMVRQIGFESGATVKRGAMMVKLDTSTEEAQLASARAEAALAKVNLERAQQLRAGEANAPADLDAAQADRKSTRL